MSEETLNILNELSKKETTELALNIMELTADNMVKDKEIERLNNILDELEKWIEEDEEKAMINFECGRCFNMYHILDKIKELRGDK